MKKYAKTFYYVLNFLVLMIGIFHPTIRFEEPYLILLTLFLATFIGTEIIFQFVGYIKEDTNEKSNNLGKC